MTQAVPPPPLSFRLPPLPSPPHTDRQTHHLRKSRESIRKKEDNALLLIRATRKTRPSCLRAPRCLHCKRGVDWFSWWRCSEITDALLSLYSKQSSVLHVRGSSVNGSICPPSQSSLHLGLRVMCHMHLHLVCQSVPHPGQTLAMTSRLTFFRCRWACTWWIFRLAALANHFAHDPQMKPSSSELSGPSCLSAFARHLYFSGSSRTFFLKILTMLCHWAGHFRIHAVHSLSAASLNTAGSSSNFGATIACNSCMLVRNSRLHGSPPLL